MRSLGMGERAREMRASSLRKKSCSFRCSFLPFGQGPPFVAAVAFPRGMPTVVWTRKMPAVVRCAYGVPAVSGHEEQEKMEERRRKLDLVASAGGRRRMVAPRQQAEVIRQRIALEHAHKQQE